MEKLIKSREEVRDKIENALRLITEPVVQTLGPKGGNVIYIGTHGEVSQTTDGETIAKQIESADPVEQSVIDVIKQSALSTNRDAGDGTTTTVMLSNSLIASGLKMIDEGKNPMQLKEELQGVGRKLTSRLKAITIEDDDQLFDVAKISANNDDDIAQHVLDVVNTAGEDGMVFIEPHNKEETYLDKDTGFIVDGGLFSQEYAQNQGALSTFDDCALLVCDKRIYYEEEAETILRVAIEAGISKLVIVARDFIGKSVNVFSANHLNNKAIELMLVKDIHATDSNSLSLNDLAVYTGAKLITDKTGKLVNNLEVTDFCRVKKAYSNPDKTVFTSLIKDNKELEKRVAALKVVKDKDEGNKENNRRLASLTNGMVTVYVGGATLIEVQEKIFRYEDAINATRSAMKFGYLPGGGIGILAAFNPNDYDEEYQSIARKLCEAPLRQLAKNCGKHDDTVLENIKQEDGVGYNAKTDTYVNMIDAGVIDPYKVVELAVMNAVSVAGVILTSNFYIVNEKEKDDK